MDDSKWYTATAVGIGVAIVVGFLVGYGLGGFGPAAKSTTSATNTATAEVTMTVGWNPNTGLDEIFPANFSVPAHTAVHFTIINFDDGANPVASMYTSVMGTTGGVETITADGSSHAVSSLTTDGIAHTFTVSTMGSGGMMGSTMLNVVVPPASSVSDPVTVGFTAYFNSTGTLTWICMAPCDPTSMSTMGLMGGLITVS